MYGRRFKTHVNQEVKELISVDLTPLFITVITCRNGIFIHNLFIFTPGY